jgi:hypothetical protein
MREGNFLHCRGELASRNGEAVEINEIHKHGDGEESDSNKREPV